MATPRGRLDDARPWRLALAVPLLVSLLLFVVPQYFFVRMSFHQNLGYGRIGDDVTLVNYVRLFSDPLYLTALFRTVAVSALARLRPDFVVHLTDATEQEIDRLAAAKMPVVVCPRIQGVMGNGIPRFDLMMERGMLVALGTDNLRFSSPDPLRELEYSSRLIRAEPRDIKAVLHEGRVVHGAMERWR